MTDKSLENCPTCGAPPWAKYTCPSCHVGPLDRTTNMRGKVFVECSRCGWSVPDHPYTEKSDPMEIPIPEEEVCESCSGLGEYWDSDTDKYKVCACREEESGQESGQDSPIIEKVKVLTKEETEAVIHKIFKELEKEVRSFPKPHIGLPYPEPWRSDAPAVVVPRDQRIEPVESTLGPELIGGLNEAIIFEKANRIIELLEEMNEELAIIKIRTGR